MGPSIKNNGALALKFQTVAIEFPEVIDEAALAVEIHGHDAFVFAPAVDADGAAAAALQREEAELAPAQGLGDFAHAFEIMCGAENKFSQGEQKFSRPR